MSQIDNTMEEISLVNVFPLLLFVVWVSSMIYQLFKNPPAPKKEGPKTGGAFKVISKGKKNFKGIYGRKSNAKKK